MMRRLRQSALHSALTTARTGEEVAFVLSAVADGQPNCTAPCISLRRNLPVFRWAPAAVRVGKPISSPLISVKATRACSIAFTADVADLYLFPNGYQRKTPLVVFFTVNNIFQNTTQ